MRVKLAYLEVLKNEVESNEAENEKAPEVGCPPGLKQDRTNEHSLRLWCAWPLGCVLTSSHAARIEPSVYHTQCLPFPRFASAYAAHVLRCSSSSVMV